LSFDLADIDDIPELVKKLHKTSADLWARQQRGAAAADGALAIMRNSDVGRLSEVNTLSAHHPHQVRGPTYDGGRTAGAS